MGFEAAVFQIVRCTNAFNEGFTDFKSKKMI